MPIAISCAQCDWQGTVKDELAGRKGKCPTCGELVPIPKKGTPPPLPGKKAIDDVPDVVDDDIVEDAEVVEEKPRPKWKKMSDSRDEDDDRPSRSRRRDDDDDDDEVRPARSRRRPADDEDDRPRPRRRRPDDDGDARPRRPKRRKRRPSGPNMAMVGGGIVLLLAMIVWWVVGLLAMDFCFYWPPIGAVIAIVTIVRGLMGHSE